MIDQTNRQPAPADLTQFTPVPREKKRCDGWTPDRQRRFIAALADLGSVRAAAHTVNMTPVGAYLLRRAPDAAEFAAAWETALALGVRRLEDIAMDRALNGVEVPLYAYGKIIGTRRVYNDALLMFMLRNRAPKRFAADSANPPDAATRAQLDRLKRQWRQEWEAERLAAEAADEEAILAEIDAKLDLMQRRSLAARNDPAEPDPVEPDPEAERAGELAQNNVGTVRPEDLLRHKSKRPHILPPPYDDPKTEREEAIADWMIHVDEGRIGEAANRPPETAPPD